MFYGKQKELPCCFYKFKNMYYLRERKTTYQGREVEYMEYDVFEKIVDESRKKYPILFALEQDEIPSREQIEVFEIKQNIVLSEKYRKVLLQFGGGYFGYANIYSLDSKSDFYLLHHNKRPIEHALYIADNGCGDRYFLQVENKTCLEQVFYFEHDTGTVLRTKYADILEYLVEVGLKATV